MYKTTGWDIQYRLTFIFVRFLVDVLAVFPVCPTFLPPPTSWFYNLFSLPTWSRHFLRPRIIWYLSSIWKRPYEWKNIFCLFFSLSLFSFVKFQILWKYFWTFMTASRRRFLQLSFISGLLNSRKKSDTKKSDTKNQIQDITRAPKKISPWKRGKIHEKVEMT